MYVLTFDKVPPVQKILDQITEVEGGKEKLTPLEDQTSDYLRELLVPFIEMQQQQMDQQNQQQAN